MSWEQEVVAEKMAFMMCDSDKMVGLTWHEVESCIQRYAGLLEDNRASNASLRKFYNPGDREIEIMMGEGNQQPPLC